MTLICEKGKAERNKKWEIVNSYPSDFETEETELSESHRLSRFP